MQKTVIILFIVLLTSCTIARKIPPKYFSAQMFKEFKVEDSFVQNRNLNIEYVSCRKRWFSNNDDAKEYLMTEFRKKYKEELYGISNVEVEQTQIIDSSIVVPSELCYRIKANPVTKKPLKVAKTETWKLIYPGHHVH